MPPSVSDFKLPSVHVKKLRVWVVKQLGQFLVLNQWASKEIVRDLPYPKIERTVPKWAMESSHTWPYPELISIKCRRGPMP